MINIGFYREQYTKALFALAKHPIILVPDIIFSFLILAGGTAALAALGVSTLLNQIGTSTEEIVTSTIITSFIRENITRLIITTILFFVALFVTGTSATAIKLGMIRDLVKNKQPSLKQGWISSKKYFWKLMGIKVLTYLLFLAALVIGTVVLGVFAPLGKQGAVLIAGIVIALLFLVILLSLFFRFPLAYRYDLSPARTIVASYKFFKANKLFTVIVALGVFLTIFLSNEIVTMLLIFLRISSPWLVLITGFIGIWANLCALVYLFFSFEKVKTK